MIWAPRAEWLTQGYALLPGAIDRPPIARLRVVCESILAEWRRRDPQTGRAPAPDATVMRHLNHPAYFAAGAPGLEDILAFAAHPKLLDFARAVLGEEPMFRCTSLFMNPLADVGDGEWHRDSQYVAADEAAERAMIASSDGGSGMQLQIALVPSDDLEVVPGSHLRYDTPEEYDIRRAHQGRNSRSNQMPGARRLELETGDAVALNSLGLHRGRYHRDKLRRTMMLTYTKSSMPVGDDFSSQPWFLNPVYRARIPAEAVPFFDRFIQTYRPFWRQTMAGSST